MQATLVQAQRPALPNNARPAARPSRPARALVARAQQDQAPWAAAVAATAAPLGRALVGAAAAAALLCGPALAADNKIAEFPTSGLIFK